MVITSYRNLYKLYKLSLPQIFFKKRGLIGSQFFERKEGGLLEKKGVTFFVGFQFLNKKYAKT